MVSQAYAVSELGNSSKKRKREDSKSEAVLVYKPSKAAESTKSTFDIELHLENLPLPLEWQQCLDIQSGKMYFYNSRTHIRTTIDPRRSQEPENTSDHMSLDLELNLQIGSPELFMDSCRYGKNKTLECVARSPLCLAVGEDQEEMMASVCSRCHMLVMMKKSSPACPNCKYLHPPDQSPPRLFKQRHPLSW